MNIIKITILFLLAIQAVPASAQSVLTKGLVAQCMRETRAPGAYAFKASQKSALVKAAATGSQRGAHDVNDCLQDKLRVQYGSGAFAGAVVAGARTSLCPKHAAVLYGGSQYCVGNRN